MFSILLVASFVLPTVLGGCCYPDKMSTVVFTAGNPVPSHLIVDFTQHKSIRMPMAGDIKFELMDFNSGLTYTKFADTSCSVAPSGFPIKQCIGAPFKATGEATLVGAHVTGYAMEAGDNRATIVVDENCLPAVLTQMANGVVITNIYTNVTSSVSDVSALTQDLSKCVSKE